MRNDTPREMTSSAGETATANPMSTFTSREWIALLQLRRRYGEGQDLWDAHELAHLHFLRWLRMAGRLDS